VNFVKATLILPLLFALAACGSRGCGDEVPEAIDPLGPVARFERPPANSPGTLLSLGPHLWEATYNKRGDSAGIHGSKVATSRLVWAELDYYEFQEFGEDALRFEERRVGPSLFRRTSGDTLFGQLAGIPGDTLILQRSLAAWREVISPFGDQVAYRRLADSTIDGRAVRVYSLALAPQVAPPSEGPLSLEAAANLAGLAVTPVELSGSLYIDLQSGNRLLAEVEGRYVPRRTMGNTDPKDEVYFTYRESRSPSQLAPSIGAPPASQVRSQQTPLRPTGKRAKRRSRRDGP
jgi:hypothetical protein